MFGSIFVNKRWADVYLARPATVQAFFLFSQVISFSWGSDRLPRLASLPFLLGKGRRA